MGLLTGIKTHRRQSEMVVVVGGVCVVVGVGVGVVGVFGIGVGVVVVVVELLFLNNNYCWSPQPAPFSPVAQKLLFMNKKMIILLPA